MITNRSTTLAALALALVACSHAAPRPPVVWPDPPEKPRIRFVTALANEGDLGTSGWDKVRRSLFGGGSEASLAHPMGLALSDDGQRLYVTDLRGSAVYVFDLQKKRLSQFASDEAWQQPFNVALDAEENVYVSDSRLQRIVVFDRNGKKLRSFGKELERPTGLALDRARGILYVADTSRVDSQNHRVYAYTLEGRLAREVGEGRGSNEGQFNFPSYLALDAKGDLYVNDTMNFRIQVFDPEGKLLRTHGEHGDQPGTFGRAKGIALDSFGNVYVADGEHAVVQIFNPQLEPLMFFGGAAPKLEFFDIPSAVAIDQKTNRIYVANELSPRVNVYELINTTADDAKAPAAEAAAAAPPTGAAR